MPPLVEHSPLWQRLLILVVAGALGTLARAGVYAGVARFITPTIVPLGTLSVNVLGSLAFGLLWPLTDPAPGQTARLGPDVRLFLLTGFMGAFTTFSTLAFEAGQSVRVHNYGAAALTLCANCLLGIGAFLLGAWITSR